MSIDEAEHYRIEGEQRAKLDGERRARSARISLIINIILGIVSIIGASVFWISLPERMKVAQERAADHETRIRALENLSGEHAATLGRIDERTKSIQESVSDIRLRLAHP
jgi:hypothetical protein